jgi:hypothetical protein
MTKYVGIKNIQWPYFEYEPRPVCGVGKSKQPIVSMDPYIDTTRNDELHFECCKGLALTEQYKMAMYPGELHISEKQKGKISFSEMLYKLTDYDPNRVHSQNLDEIIKTAENPRQAIYKYMYFCMGADIPWFFALYLRNQDFSKKLTTPEILWTDVAKKYFPKIVEYVEKLPFQTVGRVLFFTTYPNAGVTAHRDYYIESHRDQNINLFFSGGWRPSFIWDDVNEKKIYLEKGSTSYFFNNRDYHGVDSEPNFRYTLRVDGVFNQHLQNELGLEDGWVWKNNRLL